MHNYNIFILFFYYIYLYLCTKYKKTTIYRDLAGTKCGTRRYKLKK